MGFLDKLFKSTGAERLFFSPTNGISIVLDSKYALLILIVKSFNSFFNILITGYMKYPIFSFLFWLGLSLHEFLLFVLYYSKI